jgi:hypothetical protein
MQMQDSKTTNTNLFQQSKEKGEAEKKFCVVVFPSQENGEGVIFHNKKERTSRGEGEDLFSLLLFLLLLN